MANMARNFDSDNVKTSVINSLSAVMIVSGE